MRNEGCSGGCLSFIAGIVLIGLVLLAIKWFGIPVGIALAILGFVQFKRFDTDPDAFNRTARSLGIQPVHLRWVSIGGMMLGAILIIASTILWAVPDDDGHRSNGNVVTESSGRNDPTRGGTYLEGPDGLNMCDQPGMAGAEIRRKEYACRNAPPRYE
ncbi:hypothetical protein [Sphingomonas pruni]|uniref:hypothetical protein n=1 Tax=Sphingomonas pruni TaxID=40683 RepID=UPI0008306117|nr:hypothetical protein [Sphingomonas pruni]